MIIKCKDEKNVLKEEVCDCPLECDAISYSYYYVASAFNPETMCPRNSIEEDFPMKEFYENPMPPKFLRKIDKFIKNETDEQGEICRKNMKYRTEVIFRLATNTMSVTVSSRRLSFFDKLSGFGI